MNMPKIIILLSLLSGSQATAVNYAPLLWNYVIGKSVPSPQLDKNDTVQGLRVVLKGWISPGGIPATALTFFYLPSLSSNHWAISLMDAEGKTADFVGAKSLNYVSQMASTVNPDEKNNVYQITGGMFNGLYVSDGIRTSRTGKKHRYLNLMTPQMYKVSQINDAIMGR